MRRRFTLWRGDKRLGWFDELTPVRHHDRVVGASGVLIAETDASGLESVMQSTIAAFPGSPTFQSPLPTESVASRGPRLHLSQELRPVPAGTEVGVPPERQYSIRTADAAVIATSSIVLEKMVVPPGKGVDVGLPLEAESAWMVVFSQLDGI